MSEGDGEEAGVTEPRPLSPGVSPSVSPAVSPAVSMGASLGSAFAILIVGIALTVGVGVLFRGHRNLLLESIMRCLMMTAFVHFLLIRLGRRSPLALGLVVTPATPRRFGVGALVGFGLVITAFAVAWGLGAYRVNVNPEGPTLGGLGTALLTMLAAALFEEMWFRVGLTGTLAASLPAGLAIMIPASLFGLLHGMNPGASTVSVTNTVLAGLLIGLLYYERGTPSGPSLGMATGFHAAWNFVLGPVLGCAVSGHVNGRTLLTVEATDTRWSGGEYGLEAGLGTSFVFVLGCAAALRYARLPQRPSAPRAARPSSGPSTET